MPPRPVFLGKVASKGLTGAMSVRVRAKAIKLPCFEIVRRWLVRAPNKKVSSAEGGAAVARARMKTPREGEGRTGGMRG